MISPSDLIKLYSAVQSSVDAEEKRKRENEFDDAVAENIRELFRDSAYPRRRRTFGAIRKSFGGYFDEDRKDLQRHLIRIGAKHKKGDGDDALWHLPTENRSIARGRTLISSAITLVVLVAIFYLMTGGWDEIRCFFCLEDRLVCGCP